MLPWLLLVVCQISAERLPSASAVAEPSSLTSIQRHGPAGPEERDALDELFDADFGDDDDETAVILDQQKFNQEDLDYTYGQPFQNHAVSFEEKRCGPEGVLRLDGTIHVQRGQNYQSCTKVIADNATLNLSAPLQFHADTLEIEGQLTIITSSSGFTCLAVSGFLRISGEVIISGCRVKHNYGGALYAKKFELSGALLIENSAATLGGGIFTYFARILGSLRVFRCLAGRGGAIFAVEELQIDGGARVEISECGASLGGGAMAGEIMQLLDGRVSIRSCYADDAGGAIFVRLVSIMKGEFWASNCSARDGGAIWSTSLQQGSGRLSIENSSADDFGGGLYLMTWNQSVDSQLQVKNCYARRGAAVYLTHFVEIGGRFLPTDVNRMANITQVAEVAGKADFQECLAREDGGALWAKGWMQFTGQLSFRHCRSNRRGGAILSQGPVKAETSNLSFVDCHAHMSGASLFSADAVQLGEVTLEGCSGGALSAVLVAKNLTIRRIQMDGAHSSSDESSEQTLAVERRAEVQEMICRNTGRCRLRGHAEEISLQKLICPVGSGRETSTSEVACYQCPPGTMSLTHEVNTPCQRCPDKAEVCYPDRLKMPAGRTVAAWNLSTTLYCPNPAACPGGALHQLQREGLATSLASPGLDLVDLEQQVSRAMCSDGYAGKACGMCAEHFGRADSSPLECVACGDQLSLMGSLAFRMVKDSFLFISASMSAARNTGHRKKPSSVLLNQLMAFATVSNIVISGLLQTGFFRELSQQTRSWLSSLDVVVDMSQGSGGMRFSMQCVLRQLGLPAGLGYCHVASMVMPIFLMTLLAMKDLWLSLVLGTNVFLPGFTAFFGKYLIFYRTIPQSQGGLLETPFLPGFCCDWLLICGAMLLCFPAGMLGWWRVGLAQGDGDKVATVPQHVLYLTLAYKPECFAWEIERLVRKMLLYVIAVLIPVTYSPAAQMECLSLVLLTSLLLNLVFRPYKENVWNASEFPWFRPQDRFALANDLHWARSRLVGQLVIVWIVSLVTLMCGSMAALVIYHLVQERRLKRRETGQSQEAQ